ncbi:Protein SKG3 [Candida viswanathii]|uniref:Protein SKG3 n=1 Tax=Candida viswanathii TaxID=5486 RepID=A0A367YBL1_9ASCO|nr:Protein SKG3 [Candida viswanathii]
MNVMKKRISSGKETPKIDPVKSAGQTPVAAATPDPNSLDGISPELIPIVTLLSSQAHRRYHEGIFMLYYDLNGDGKPADREWKEVYGILTGNQLAYWDAANLAQFKSNPSALLETSSKPAYINFTDSVYNAMKVLPAAKQNLDNVIIVSTTLKNRYILQFKSYNDLTTWYSALRLSNFEYTSLQEAYTGALLSARGSRLSDIRTILAEKRFDHEDWVSIRYGSGMAWKRCYAVIEPSTTKRKSFTPGRILFFENEQKKKKQLMAVVTNASAVSAIYPQSPLLIDHSTMLKMEGFINFDSPSLSTKVPKKSAGDFKHTAIYLMPEQHSSVPGFDTLIRFLVPLMDTFGLYGRPKRLKANRNDPDSLLFGLPTLPRVHYLELDDALQLTKGDFLSWDLKTWNTNIKQILKGKLDRGYEGCGSQRGYQGAVSSLNSPVVSSGSPRFPGSLEMSTSSRLASSSLSQQQKPPQPLAKPPTGPEPKPASSGLNRNVNYLSIGVPPKTADVPSLTVEKTRENHKSVELAEIYQKYSDIQTPSDQFDRNAMLNGSHEKILEDDLPAGVRQMNLNGNIYPKDDDGLFSDDEDEEDTGFDKVDVRNIGMNSDGTPSTPSMGSLKVPYAEDRAGSYSSVMSPMAQFNDFKDTYKKQTEKRNPYPNNSEDEDESGSPTPPPVPAHDAKYRPDFPGNISSVSLGVAASRGSTSKTSVHSEVGRVTSGSSTESFTKNGEDINIYPSMAPKPLTGKPRYISSPNSSQNNLHSSRSPDRLSPARKAGNLQYPVSPNRIEQVAKSSDNLNDAMKMPALPPMQQKLYQPSPPIKQQQHQPVSPKPQQVQPQQPRPQHPYQVQTGAQQPRPLNQNPYPTNGQVYPQQFSHQTQNKPQPMVPHQPSQPRAQPQQQQARPQQLFYGQPLPQQVRMQQPPPQQMPQGYRSPPPQQQQYPQGYKQRAAPPPQQQQPQYGRPAPPQNNSNQGPMQSRGSIPRNNGQAPPPQQQQYQRQQQPNAFRGYDSQQQQQYSYLPSKSAQQPNGRPVQQTQPAATRYQYGGPYSDQYANGSSRNY